MTTTSEVQAPFLALGFEDVSTGGGCRALERRYVSHADAVPAGVRIFATNGDLDVPRAGEEIVLSAFADVPDERGDDYTGGRTFPAGSHAEAAAAVAGLVDYALHHAACPFCGAPWAADHPVEKCGVAPKDDAPGDLRAMVLADGTRVLVAGRDEWHALAAAVEVAFEDPDSVPEEFKAAGARLADFFAKGH